jgi:hypothetical protein
MYSIQSACLIITGTLVVLLAENCIFSMPVVLPPSYSMRTIEKKLGDLKSPVI